MAPSRHDWKIVDWDVKPQHNQPTNFYFQFGHFVSSLVISYPFRIQFGHFVPTFIIF